MKVSGPIHSQVILKIVKFAEQKEDVLFCFTLRMKNKSLDLSRQCQYSVTDGILISLCLVHTNIEYQNTIQKCCEAINPYRDIPSFENSVDSDQQGIERIYTIFPIL